MCGGMPACPRCMLYSVGCWVLGAGCRLVGVRCWGFQAERSWSRSTSLSILGQMGGARATSSRPPPPPLSRRYPCSGGLSGVDMGVYVLGWRVCGAGCRV